MFNPKRLVLARKRRKLTGRELAEKIGMSPVTISRIEKANNEPDPETVDLFVSALNFPKQFFFGDDLDEPIKDEVSFRSLKLTSAKERDAAIAAGTISYLISDWVNKKFNLPKPDLINLGADEADPIGAAAALRRCWGLGERPISNMIKLLESKGIRVFSLAEKTKNIDAFSCWRDDTPYIFLNMFKTTERSRFDAAHELGHLILHRYMGKCQGKEAEIEANYFASAFLMPDDDVLSKIPFVSSLQQLVLAKKRWGVSVAALSYRLHKLKILSDWQYRTFYIQINRRYGKTEPDSLPREASVVWSKVFTALWQERITKSHIAKDLHIPASEIENAVFGLVGVPMPTSNTIGNSRPFLKVV